MTFETDGAPGGVESRPSLLALFGELEKLRLMAEELLIEKDSLLYHACPALRAAYMVYIGTYEYKLFQLELDGRILRRKIELAQAKVNRGEPVDRREIDRLIEEEFRSIQDRIIAWSNALLEAGHFLALSEPLPQRDMAEFKRLYRAIMKLIHPDILGQEDEKSRILYDIAVAAYKKGQLETLRAIMAVLGGKSIEPLSALDAAKEIKRLEGLIPTLEKDIERIKNSFPYIKKELLADKEKLEAETAALKKLLEERKSELVAAEKRLRVLFGEDDGGQIH